MLDYAVLGAPVAHSQSPQLHQQFAKANATPLRYGKLSCSIDDFSATIHAFHQLGGKGLSITLPFKRLAFEIASFCDQSAQLTGVANGLMFRQDTIYAMNSDGTGLVADFNEKGIKLNNQSILILGAGGAAQGIIPALLQAGAKLSISNRTAEKAQYLCQRFSPIGKISVIDHAETQPVNIIINASSAGHTQLSPSIETCWISPQTLAYDLSYGRAALPFLNKAKQLGSQHALDGNGMLYHSALQLFNWWHNHQLPN